MNVARGRQPPTAPRSLIQDEALDYATFDADSPLPSPTASAPPTASTRTAAPETLARSRSREQRRRSATPREFSKVTLPIKLPEQTITTAGTEKQIGGESCYVSAI
jgi:hypothetical protein